MLQPSCYFLSYVLLLNSFFSMGASAIIQPLDVIKNRMQLSGEGGKKRDHSNSFQAVKNIVKKEGVRGLYQGISATMVRQGTYTTARLGLFQIGVDSIAK